MSFSTAMRFDVKDPLESSNDTWSTSAKNKKRFDAYSRQQKFSLSGKVADKHALLENGKKKREGFEPKKQKRPHRAGFVPASNKPLSDAELQRNGGTSQEGTVVLTDSQLKAILDMVIESKGNKSVNDYDATQCNGGSSDGASNVSHKLSYDEYKEMKKRGEIEKVADTVPPKKVPVEREPSAKMPIRLSMDESFRESVVDSAEEELKKLLSIPRAHLSKAEQKRLAAGLLRRREQQEEAVKPKLSSWEQRRQYQNQFRGNGHSDTSNSGVKDQSSKFVYSGEDKAFQAATSKGMLSWDEKTSVERGEQPDKQMHQVNSHGGEERVDTSGGRVQPAAIRSVLCVGEATPDHDKYLSTRHEEKRKWLAELNEQLEEKKRLKEMEEKANKVFDEKWSRLPQYTSQSRSQKNPGENFHQRNNSPPRSVVESYTPKKHNYEAESTEWGDSGPSALDTQPRQENQVGRSASPDYRRKRNLDEPLLASVGVSGRSSILPNYSRHAHVL